MGLISRVSSRTYRDMLRLGRHLRSDDVKISYFKQTPGEKLKAKLRFGTFTVLGWASFEIYTGDPGFYKNLVMPCAKLLNISDNWLHSGVYPRIKPLLPQTLTTINFGDFKLKTPLGVFNVDENLAKTLIDKGGFSFVQTTDIKTIDNCLATSKICMEDSEIINVIRIDIPVERNTAG